MLGFSCYKICYFIYSSFTKILKGQKKSRESERESVLQLHLEFLKGMIREDIESLYVLFVFIYIFGKCLIFISD